jgi:hypothetical protein
MGRCCCCGGPYSAPCTPMLCPCSTSNQYLVTPNLIAGGAAEPGSATDPSIGCCDSWNRTWTMSYQSGPIGSPFFFSCWWRESHVNNPTCNRSQSAHLYVLASDHPLAGSNPCRVYLEFSFNGTPRVDANVHARYYTDSFDCNAGGTFVQDSTFTFKCTGWSATFPVTKV